MIMAISNINPQPYVQHTKKQMQVGIDVIYYTTIQKQTIDQLFTSTNTYCFPCCPLFVRIETQVVEDSTRKEQEERANIAAKNMEMISDRRAQLTNALTAAGLELRADSVLCSNYILQNDGNIPHIISRMSQMKYLFEYCNIRDVMAEIIKSGTFTPAGKYSLLREAEKRILEKIGSYPAKFPWLK